MKIFLIILILFFSLKFQASDEYRETSTHKVQRRSKKSHTHHEESVIEETSSKRVQKTYSTERSTTSTYSTISLTNIPLPSSSTDGTVTCKYIVTKTSEINQTK